MGSLYNQIRPYKITEEIVEQIKTLIKNGSLQPGEKLPPERELAELFAVGRSSLREALNTLETHGFVEKKKRKGVYIRTLSSSTISDPLKIIIEEDRSKLSAIYELRKDIELVSAEKAAMVRTGESLARIRGVLDKMELNAKKFHFEKKNDLNFHLAIAQAAGNILRVHMLKNIIDLCDNHRDYVAHRLIKDKRHVPLLLEQHQSIFNAIENGDPALAKSQMEKHLNWVEVKWKEFGASSNDGGSNE